MARTLADMTPEERQACVGLWCDNLASTAKEPTPVVLVRVQGDLCWVLHTNIHGERSYFSLGSVSPVLICPVRGTRTGHYPMGAGSIVPQSFHSLTTQESTRSTTVVTSPNGRPPMIDPSTYTPELAAAELASDFPSRIPEYILERAIRAMATLAAMAEEVEHRIVDPDTNGGRYEMRRHVRYVTDWGVDE